MEEKEVTVKEREEPEASDARTVMGSTRAAEGWNTYTFPHPTVIALKLATDPAS